MQTTICKSRLPLVLLSTLAFVPFAPGCGGGSSATNPITYAGSYKGTYTATYDPGSPRAGTFQGTLDFTIATNGTVTVNTPLQIDRTNTGTSKATGKLSGTQIVLSNNQTLNFGIRSLQGQLSAASGETTGSGTITVVNQVELASGTWQAQKQ